MIQSRDVISEAVFERYLRPQMDDMIRSDDPTTVFLGAQPAAGKTRGQRRVLGMYPGASLFPVIGDDYRRYHPDYNRLIAEDPVRMPDVTAELSGRLVGKVVDYADRLGISIIIEGTWRNSATVLGEAERAFAAGRRLHAALLAVPPDISRLGLLERFYYDMDEGRDARWTPPRAHEDTVRSLPDTVRRVAASSLFSRFTTLSRDGDILYDGTDGSRFENAWSKEFHRPLNDTELAGARESLPLLMELHDVFTPFEKSSLDMMEDLRAKTDEGEYPAIADDIPTSRSPQPRIARGLPGGGRWTRRGGASFRLE